MARMATKISVEIPNIAPAPHSASSIPIVNGPYAPTAEDQPDHGTALKRREEDSHLFSGGSVAHAGPEEDPEHHEEPNPAAGYGCRFVEPKGKQTNDVADGHNCRDSAAANLIGDLACADAGKGADNPGQTRQAQRRSERLQYRQKYGCRADPAEHRGRQT